MENKRPLGSNELQWGCILKKTKLDFKELDFKELDFKELDFKELTFKELGVLGYLMGVPI